MAAALDSTSSPLHNSDMRDSHEYIQKQVRVGRGVSKHLQGGVEEDLVETRLTEASSIICYDFAHPTYLETYCVLMRVS